MGLATGPATAARPMDEDYSAVLARFACTLSASRLPAEAVAAVQANIFDTLACAAAGSSAQGVAEVRALATEWGGAPQAAILVFGDRVPAHQAAWVNGMMAHARDYDDTHDAAVLHAGVSVVPAALAAAALRGTTPGEDFLAAVAAGLETICRLGVATQASIIETGFIYTPLFGYFAATVAASRILGLDPEQTANALGIAYSQVAGNHQVTRDGALTKRMQPGFAAQAALVSVQLARRGIRGARRTFEGEDGFLRVYLRDRCDREALRSGLGKDYEFVRLSYKPYPCCRLNHSAIDAALALRREGLAPHRIRRLRVGVNRQAYEAVCTPVDVRKAPQSVVQSQFSLPYTVAAALVDGHVGLGHFETSALARPDILALARLVDAYVDDDIERRQGRNVTPAVMRAELVDGTVRDARIDVPLGHPSRPMPPAAADAKAHDCFAHAALALSRDAVPRLRGMVDRLEDMGDARVLADVLAPPS